MKISLNWLNQYVECDEFFSEPEKLGDILTAAGLEVENLENFAERFKNVVTGQVVELKKHPDADKLTLCQVDAGEGNLRQIICGAKNHKQGDKVVVALPGAILPGNFKIKDSKIRGVESKGMLCSEVELGLGEESSGIMILPKDVEPGQEFAVYHGLKDVVFDLSVTPNRADCLSHYGLARELACLLDRPLTMPKLDVKTGGGKTVELISLENKNYDACPRYAGRAIRGVEVKESPAWLKSALESVGMNSINNIVDVTNYVMMELGQPLHAFDADFLQDSKIIIANSTKGEKFTTLDGTEVELTGEELTIRDGQKAVALAGVVGSPNSGVVEKTKDVFLESAYFTSGPNRRTSRRFGIQTESCYRFSRGTDPEGVITAMNRACHLIQQVAGGEVAPDHHDLYPNPLGTREILINKTYLEERLGYPVNMDEFSQWMKRLGCKVTDGTSANEQKITVPLFRWDLWEDVDLVEEFARLHGYDKIPETLPAMNYEPLPADPEYLQDQELINLFSAEGYTQAVNFAFIGEDWQKDFLGQPRDERTWGLRSISDPVKIVNPISEDLNVMRTSLLAGLWKNVLHNFRHGSEIGRLFETGHVFYKNELANESNDNLFGQDFHVAAAAWGQTELLWQKDRQRPVVFDLKANIENVLSALGKSGYQWRSFTEEQCPSFLHPGQSATLFLEGKIAGFVGSLHPQLVSDQKLRCEVAVGEFAVAKVMRGWPKTRKVKSIAKFPAVQRDFSFVMGQGQEVADVIKQIEKVGGKLLQKVEVFDIYEGENLAEGQRSVSFRLTYQDMDGTMSDEQLTQLQSEIVNKVSQKLG